MGDGEGVLVAVGTRVTVGEAEGVEEKAGNSSLAARTVKDRAIEISLPSWLRKVMVRVCWPGDSCSGGFQDQRPSGSI